MTNDVQLIQLMRDCWDEFPTLRPDFVTIRNRFLVINKGKYDSFNSNGNKDCIKICSKLIRS